MAFPPEHPGHVFLGYRGVSTAHFRIEPNKQIRYTMPPADVAGGTQLGAGVYMTSHLRDASDYAKDSAWNLYCSKIKGARDTDAARAEFEKHRWQSWGQIHAVFAPENAFGKSPIADFSHINVDRMGEHVGNNMMHAVKNAKPRYAGVKTQLFEAMQTVIYPPHTNGLFVKDVTKEAVELLSRS